MKCDVSILLKLALNVVKDLFCDVSCVKCKKVYGLMLHFSQVTHSSPQSESKGTTNEYLFIINLKAKDLEH